MARPAPTYRELRLKLRVNTWTVAIITITMLLGGVHITLGDKFEFGPLLSHKTLLTIAIISLLGLCVFNYFYRLRRK